MSADQVTLFMALGVVLAAALVFLAFLRLKRRANPTATKSNYNSTLGIASLEQSLGDVKSGVLKPESAADSKSTPQDGDGPTKRSDGQETNDLGQLTTKPAPANFERLCSLLSAAGAETEMAPVLLAKGQSLIAAGKTKEAARALRQAIEVAVENGMADIHALARLELAEICRADGDLTTACEHWHLAKQLFIAQSRTESSATTDTRMRAHGCPTEWVLTEF